jgi:hypothetical protein
VISTPRGRLGKEKKKEAKKKRKGGGLWKRPQPWKSSKDAYGDILWMISTAAWKTLLGFPPFPQARRRRFHHPYYSN